MRGRRTQNQRSSNQVLKTQHIKAQSDKSISLDINEVNQVKSEESNDKTESSEYIEQEVISRKNRRTTKSSKSKSTLSANKLKKNSKMNRRFFSVEPSEDIFKNESKYGLVKLEDTSSQKNEEKNVIKKNRNKKIIKIEIPLKIEYQNFDKSEQIKEELKIPQTKRETRTNHQYYQGSNTQQESKDPEIPQRYKIVDYKKRLVKNKSKQLQQCQTIYIFQNWNDLSTSSAHKKLELNSKEASKNQRINQFHEIVQLYLNNFEMFMEVSGLFNWCERQGQKDKSDNYLNVL